MHHYRLIPMLLLVAGVPLSALVTQDSTACKAADSETTHMLSRLKTIVMSTDARLIKLRNSVGLPAIDSSQVVLMTNAADSLVCQQARQAYVASFKTDTVAVPSVYVVGVGTTRYVVTDAKARIGEFADWAVLDTTFKVLAGIAN